VHEYAVMTAGFAQDLKVNAIVAVLEEACGPVVASLDDVQRQVG
jgi:hypothetical protein